MEKDQSLGLSWGKKEVRLQMCQKKNDQNSVKSFHTFDDHKHHFQKACWKTNGSVLGE